jgi:hypothetical protein
MFELVKTLTEMTGPTGHEQPVQESLGGVGDVGPCDPNWELSCPLGW